MSNAKEIRTKIKSVQNTQKITRAMEKVAMSKMRKAQDRMAAAKPYADRIRRTIGHLAHAALDARLVPVTVGLDELSNRRVDRLLVDDQVGPERDGHQGEQGQRRERDEPSKRWRS